MIDVESRRLLLMFRLVLDRRAPSFFPILMMQRTEEL
jgi:hypothetical protein